MDKSLNGIQTLSALVSRVNLMAKLGQQYDNDRDIYETLGYKKILTYNDYAARYERQEIAAAVIDRPIDGSWKGRFEVRENKKDRQENTKTVFEQTWENLEQRLAIISKMIRLDRVAGIGHYGILLLGLDDIKKTTDFAAPVAPGGHELLYIKPLGEGNVEISKWVENKFDERYGFPEFYTVEIVNPGTDTSVSILVHYSRILHVSPGVLLESETEGVPRLKRIYNRLMDLEKLVGSSAEMFWRGARPGYQAKVDKEYQLGDAERDNLQDQIDEFEHNLRRILAIEGVTLSALKQQVADPANHIDAQLQMISAEKKIPKRILTGSERGELASSQDQNEWLSYLQERQKEYNTGVIVKPFIDMCIKYGILPIPENGYEIIWQDLFAKGEKEHAEVGKIRAESLAAYSKFPLSQEFITPGEFFKFFLGLTDQQIIEIQKTQIKMIENEDTDAAKD